jgi:YidC/Oxa1 family membrane protein insertase
LTIQQQKSTKAMQALQPKMQELQKKYAKDKEALNRETMKLYQEAGVNPFGGCLPLLLQFPIFIGLYQVIMLVLAVNPLQLLNLASHLQGWLPQAASSLLGASLSSLIPLNNRFLWLNLGQPDPFYILPVLTVITTYLQQKVMTPPSTDPQSQSMNQMMTLYMPLMFGWIVTTVPSGLGLYWLISNVIGVVQYWMIGRPQPAEGVPEFKSSQNLSVVATLVAHSKRLKSSLRNRLGTVISLEMPKPELPSPAESEDQAEADEVTAPPAGSEDQAEEAQPVTTPPARPVPHLRTKRKKRKR